MVVGAVNVDFVVAAQRLPGPGQTVVGPGLVKHGGGKGANAAVAAARVGAQVRLIGAVGADDIGSTALAELRAEGVDVSDVAVLDAAPTGVALIVVDAAGENQIAVGAGANAGVDPDHVLAAMDAVLPTTGCVLVSTEIAPEAVAAAVESATAAGVPCVLNPAPPIPAVSRLVRLGPVLTPNTTELAELASSADSLAAHSGSPVVVTLGGDGVLVAQPGLDTEHLPAHPAEVRDTTGAGDTFNGVLAARLAAGEDVTTAARMANRAAALSVAEVGARTGMPTAEALGERSF